MPRTGVTYKQVIYACRTLARERKPITARAVLARTGGSLSTIVTHLQRWRQEKEGAAPAAMGEELSPQIKQAILAECARKTSLAKKQWMSKIEALEQRLMDMQKLLDKTKLEKKKLTLDLKKANSKIIKQDKR